MIEPDRNVLSLIEQIKRLEKKGPADHRLIQMLLVLSREVTRGEIRDRRVLREAKQWVGKYSLHVLGAEFPSQEIR